MPGLDDFRSGKNPYGSSSSSSSGGGGGGSSLTSARNSWQTKLDFGIPYVVVAVDRQGSVYKNKGNAEVLDRPDHPGRLEDNPHKEVKVEFKVASYEDWLLFCNYCKEQLGEDPNKVLEEEPLRLAELEERVHYPPGKAPGKDRTCQVCGASSKEPEVSMMELDLEKHRRTPVCSEHTIADLAESGLLQ